MPVKSFDGGLLITGNHITLFSVLSLAKSIELEGKGLRFKGGSRLAKAKRLYNLKGNRESVVAQLEKIAHATVETV